MAVNGAGDLTVGFNMDVVCTITNTRKTGKIELVEGLVPEQPDAGRFDLFIKQGASRCWWRCRFGAEREQLGPTGENTVNTGVYNVTEAACTGGDLSDYNVAGPGLHRHGERECPSESQRCR